MGWMLRRTAGPLVAALALLAMLAGCDPQRISELEEGVSTEADVRARFGEPEKVWDEPGGGHTLEYNRQPQGHQNYMVTIAPDGRMSALRQVLAPHNFAKVVPGMEAADVRRLLGKPRRITPYALKRQTEWDWRYVDPPNTQMLFTVTFDAGMRVAGSGSMVETPEGN